MMFIDIADFSQVMFLLRNIKIKGLYLRDIKKISQYKTG